MPECKSFIPHINNKSEILVLGSMPGVKSLEKQEYYAHPHNRFWKIMGMICNYTDMQNLSYKEKLSVLSKNKIALWDVIGVCKREGSLDSSIYNVTPNNINKLLSNYKNIKKICLNGNKSFSEFKRNFPELLEKYECYKMPSTSPANAKYSLTDLYNEWKKVL